MGSVMTAFERGLEEMVSRGHFGPAWRVGHLPPCGTPIPQQTMLAPRSPDVSLHFSTILAHRDAAGRGRPLHRNRYIGQA